MPGSPGNTFSSPVLAPAHEVVERLVSAAEHGREVFNPKRPVAHATGSVRGRWKRRAGQLSEHRGRSARIRQAVTNNIDRVEGRRLFERQLARTRSENRGNRKEEQPGECLEEGASETAG
jgi:hypothetical protein